MEVNSDLKRSGGRFFYGWWVVIAGSLISAVGVGITYYCFTVFFLPLKRDLLLSSAAVSLVYGASRLEGGIEGPLVGYLIDRFGPGKMIFAGATLAGIGFLLLSRVNTFLTLFIVYVLVISLGASAGFFSPVSAAINNWFIRRRSTAFAIITAAGSFGGVIMAPVLSYFILSYSWRDAAIVAGVIILTVLPLVSVMRRSPEEYGLLPDGGPLDNNVNGETSSHKYRTTQADYSVKAALKTITYWILTMCISLRILVTVALSAHLIPVLVWKGMDEATAAYLVSLGLFATMLSMLVVGWIGDRWNKSLLCSLSMLATVVCMLVLLSSHSEAALYLFPIGLAISMGTVPLNWSLIGDIFGRRSYATLRGIMGVVYGTATFISPIYAGWMFDRTGDYTIVLVSFAIALVLGSILFEVLRRLTLRPG